MLGKRLSNAQRIQEIFAALIRNGFDFIIKDLGMFDLVGKIQKKKVMSDEEVLSKNIGERVRITLEELGPTFIKLGQLASTRIDLFPQEIIRELAKLQDNVKPVPFEDIKKIIEEEFNIPLENLFSEFSRTPVASASIGQVHRAKLKTGEEVAIKVQRPNIENTIEKDLEILNDLAILIENRTDWGKNYRVYDIVKELSSSLRMELDYTREAKNAERCATKIKKLDYVKIPDVFWDYTTKRVLTMEFIHAQKLDAFIQAGASEDKEKIAMNFAHCMFEQIFVGGFFHADPHPGNVFITADRKITLIDFGMVGRLSPQMKFDLASLLIALKDDDLEEITAIVTKIGQLSEETNRDRLLFDLDHLLAKYANVSLKKVNISELLNEVIRICYENQIRIPADLTMLAKTLLTMEGVLSRLHPDFVLMDLAEPFGRRLIRERYEPKAIIKNARSKFREIQNILNQFEVFLRSFTKKGKLQVEMDLPDIQDLLHKMDRITNQLSFSIVLLAFSIMMSGLVIGAAIMKEQTILWSFPVIEIGGIAATLMFLWLLYSILKSGRF